LAESTVGALDLRYLERWAAARRKPAPRRTRTESVVFKKAA
jgi:hypothetical protein